MEQKYPIWVFCLLLCLDYFFDSCAQAEATPVKCLQDCTRLNRFHCQRAAHACGECYYGYIPEVTDGEQCVIDKRLSKQEIEEDIREVLELENLIKEKERLAAKEMSKLRQAPASETSTGATAHAQANPAQPQVHHAGKPEGQVQHEHSKDSPVFSPPLIGVIVGLCVLAFVGIIIATVLVYRTKEKRSLNLGPDYGTTSHKDPGQGDRKLAQSAQMYHFQHQRQQMMMLEQANSDLKTSGEESESADEGGEGDYTVFECAGLAPTGEMEVPNPLYDESAAIARAERQQVTNGH